MRAFCGQSAVFLSGAMKNCFQIFIALIFTSKLCCAHQHISTSAHQHIAILLTACVRPIPHRGYTRQYMQRARVRLRQYVRTINLYLNSTGLPILLVESSGYSFNIFHERLRQLTFNTTITLASSTTQEAVSILAAYDAGLFKGFAKIIKVTGKYFLPELEREISKIPYPACIIYQHSHLQPHILSMSWQVSAIGKSHAWQNSEVFGFCSSITRQIFGPISQSFSGAKMEYFLVDIHLTLNTPYYRLPTLRILHKVRRGDSSVLNVL